MVGFGWFGKVLGSFEGFWEGFGSSWKVLVGIGWFGEVLKRKYPFSLVIQPFGGIVVG